MFLFYGYLILAQYLYKQFNKVGRFVLLPIILIILFPIVAIMTPLYSIVGLFLCLYYYLFYKNKELAKEYFEAIFIYNAAKIFFN